jgi:N-acetylglucosamine kinase-like BadF-type ATPase
MNYFLGMDVGGTKTDCIIANEEGVLLAHSRTGSGSYEYHGVDHARKENEKAVRHALNMAELEMSDITMAGLGVAGADLPEDFAMLEAEIYTPLFGETRRVFHNDSIAALKGGMKGKDGIVIICGTGAIAAGLSAAGETARAGGLGADYTDAWTGQTIGEEGLRCVWRALEGIIPPTCLTEHFVARSGYEDANTLFQKVYRDEMPPELLEPKAQLVFKAALDGDSMACDILISAGIFLGRMVNAVARKLDFKNQSIEIITAGSVFAEGAPVLMAAMVDVIQECMPNTSFKKPEFAPVIGALMLSFESAGQMTDAIMERIIEEIPKAENKFAVQLRN